MSVERRADLFEALKGKTTQSVAQPLPRKRPDLLAERLAFPL